jgi:hypothetical protein
MDTLVGLSPTRRPDIAKLMRRNSLLNHHLWRIEVGNRLAQSHPDYNNLFTTNLPSSLQRVSQRNERVFREENFPGGGCLAAKSLAPS